MVHYKTFYWETNEPETVINTIKNNIEDICDDFSGKNYDLEDWEEPARLGFNSYLDLTISNAFKHLHERQEQGLTMTEDEILFNITSDLFFWMASPDWSARVIGPKEGRKIGAIISWVNSEDKLPF